MVELGNRSLASGGMALFGEDGEAADDGYDCWNDAGRVQALYTLVR